MLGEWDTMGLTRYKLKGNYHKLYFYKRFKNYFFLEILSNIKYYQFTTHGIVLPVSKVLYNQIKMLFLYYKNNTMRWSVKCHFLANKCIITYEQASKEMQHLEVQALGIYRKSVRKLAVKLM